jgi:ATP-binding cassette subfamily F protein 3
LKPNYSVYDSLIGDAHPKVTEQEIKELAGALLFSGDDIHKKISVLSGGERTRVALGKILLSKAPVLLFDEPTNHLDFSTVEALTQSLKKYEGTVIVVSHDRGFIGRISSQILEINHGKVALFPGNYDEYLWSVEQGSFGENQRKASKGIPKEESEYSKNDEPEAPKEKINFKEKRKSLERYIRVANTEAEKIEAKLESFKAKLEEVAKLLESHDPTDASGIQKLSERASDLQSSIDLHEYRWMEAMEEKENHEKELNSFLEAFGARK